MKNQGWTPDLVICHTGWGCGIYVKEIWPRTTLLCYLEWWFNPESDFFHYDPSNKYLSLNEKSIPKCWLRNQQIALELASGDAIISPTEWQKNQLPNIFKQKCNVIFDGIDTEVFKFTSNNKRKNIITYGTRGMDPMRCFPQLINEIIGILNGNTSSLSRLRAKIVVFTDQSHQAQRGGNGQNKTCRRETRRTRQMAWKTFIA